VVHASSPSRHHLVGGGAPHRSPTSLLTAIGPEKTGLLDFYSFKQGLSVPVHFMWQHILMTPLGNRLLQARQAWRVKTPATMDPTSTRSHPQAHLRHLDIWGSQGVRSVSRQYWRALPLALRSDAAWDCSQGHYVDRLQQARGNTRGTIWPIALSQ
jgi:hypothetical protein